MIHEMPEDKRKNISIKTLAAHLYTALILMTVAILFSLESAILTNFHEVFIALELQRLQKAGFPSLVLSLLT